MTKRSLGCNGSLAPFRMLIAGQQKRAFKHVHVGSFKDIQSENFRTSMSLAMFASLMTRHSVFCCVTAPLVALPMAPGYKNCLLLYAIRADGSWMFLSNVQHIDAGESRRLILPHRNSQCCFPRLRHEVGAMSGEMKTREHL